MILGILNLFCKQIKWSVFLISRWDVYKIFFRFMLMLTGFLEPILAKIIKSESDFVCYAFTPTQLYNFIEFWYINCLLATGVLVWQYIRTVVDDVLLFRPTSMVRRREFMYVLHRDRSGHFSRGGGFSNPAQGGVEGNIRPWRRLWGSFLDTTWKGRNRGTHFFPLETAQLLRFFCRL